MSGVPSARAAARTRRLLIAFAAVALVAVRKSDSLLNPQFWAEDGALFFIEAEGYGGWFDLFRAYEGYLHFIPRFIAATATALPLEIVPGFYAGCALAVTGMVAWWLQSPRIPLPGGWVAALAIGAVPHTGEVWLTTSNLQWITALGLFALVIVRDADTATSRGGELGFLAITGLTGPFIILALPMFLWRAIERRSRWSWILCASAGIIAACHLPSLLARTQPAEVVPWAPWHHLAIAGRRTVGTLFFGHLELNEMIAALLGLGFTAIIIPVLWQQRARLKGGLPLLFAALVVLAATGYKARPDTWTLSELGNGDRYFFIPKVILLWLLAALALTSHGRVRITLVAAGVVALAANAPRFFIPPAPDQHWSTSCELIARGQPVWVPILPADSYMLHPGRRPR